MTSLAAQLNALKLYQKDALSVPKRARVSLLFDAKTAANIDDQTLFYICKAGAKQLQIDGLLDLAAFEGDILNEQSLTFYRGTETKETNQIIDDQVGALIKALAPFLLEQSALKVVEYLMRIYECHIFHKQTMILAFMPLFETVYFLRAIQCFNLKDDQVWGWLNEFAYQGQSIDKPTLTKCLARHNGLVFCLCAEFNLEVNGALHIKWFGVFLSEVLRTNANEALMFGILPLISKAIRQDCRDLRVSCFLALGQLACRRVLTAEYISAFTRQLLQSLAAYDQLEFDEDLKLKGLATILLFTQYYQVCFEQKHWQLIQKMPKLPKLLKKLSYQYDTSSLSKVVLESQHITVPEKSQYLQAMLSLKTVFQAVQTLINKALAQPDHLQDVQTHLDMVEALHPDHFKQSAIFVLKQVQPAARQSILQLLRGTVENFGGQEFSVVSALSSSKKANRDAALVVIVKPDYFRSVNPKETTLIHLVLLQVLSQATHDEATLQQMLTALLGLPTSDSDFEVLAALLDQITSHKLTYSDAVSTQIVALLATIKVEKPKNVCLYAWLIYQHSSQQTNSQNAFIDLVKKPDQLAAKFVERPALTTQLILALFYDPRAFVDYSALAKLIKKISHVTAKDVSHSALVQQLILPILSCMKKQAFSAANYLMLVLAETDPGNAKLASKLLGVSLVQKQWKPSQVDLGLLHKKLFADRQKFAELMVVCACTSGCKVKRTFACQVLTTMHQKGKQFQQAQLSGRIMVGVVLMLLNEPERAYREHALLLADEVLQMYTKAAKDKSIDTLELFTDTEKPTSAQKQPVKPNPMKPKSVAQLLYDILDAKTDLVLDQSQLKPVLGRHYNAAVFEEILRTLMDYPTFALKHKLLAVLSLPQNHAVIFCLNLSQMLSKLFVQTERASMTGCLDYLTTLGGLISHLQENAAKTAQKEVLSSLTLPFLKYIVDKKILPQLVYSIFDHSVLVQDILSLVEQRTLKEIFKLFLKAANTKLKHLFIIRATAIYKGEDLAQCLVDSPNLELALETALSLAQSPSSKLCDYALVTLERLVQKHVNDEDSAYQIELCSQLVLQCMPTKQDSSLSIAAICEKVWLKTQSLTEKGLQVKGEPLVSAFDEFMQGEEKEEVEDDVDLLPSLQVTVSVVNLLTAFELKQGDIPRTTKILYQIAAHLETICARKDDTASMQVSIKSQLYHLYQSLLLRTHQKCYGLLVCSPIILQYVATCLYLIDNGAMSKQLLGQDLILNVIKTAPYYASLVCFYLLKLASARDNEITDQGLIKVDVNPALLLLQQVMLWQLDFHMDLSAMRDLFYLVHRIELSASDQVEQQTDLLFGDYTNEHSDAANALMHGVDSKAKRKLIYLACTIFTYWALKTGAFVGRLADIAGTASPGVEVEGYLLYLLLSSYIMREQVTYQMVASSSYSLVRLQNVISKWQHALNEMMSLYIHIQLVMQILRMPVQALQTNTLCLLLEKMATFSGGWLAKTPSDLQKVVVQLVQLAVTLLNEKPSESIAQLLLTVLARTASSCLPREVQIASLTTTMQQHKGSLQLQTQTVLTEMTLMETYSLQVLDYFHLFLQHTLDGFTTYETLFADTYKHALLKAFVCITQIFLKFLSATQLEQIICLSMMCVSEGTVISREGDPVEMVLENITSEAVTLKKIVLQATMNSYSMLAAQTDHKRFSLMADRYFGQLLAPLVRRLPQSFITEHHSKFVLFFKQMYGLPLKQPCCTAHIVACFNAFILKMNEDTLRPIIVALAKWSTKDPHRKLVFFEILCGCLDTLREFFVPMFKIYFDSLALTFTDCFKGLSVATKLVKRTHSAASELPSIELLTTACRLAELNYKYDSNSFIYNDSFEVLCDPIANLFELSGLPNFTAFVETRLKPLILEMDERTADDNMWQKLNLALLMKTRSDSWETRLAVLSVVDHLFEKMRERYLVILNDTIPFISELLEDENERVELAAKTIVNRIENLTGESINEYLK